MTLRAGPCALSLWRLRSGRWLLWYWWRGPRRLPDERGGWQIGRGWRARLLWMWPR